MEGHNPKYDHGGHFAGWAKKQLPAVIEKPQPAATGVSKLLKFLVKNKKASLGGLAGAGGLAALLGSGALSVEEHPEEVVDVDPDIIEQMKKRLAEEQSTGKATELPWWDR